jgi:type IVB pilus formation R64 PilN family outer membrane protein
MKKLLLIIIFVSIISKNTQADIKDIVYDGKEIYIHVKKDHLTTVIFPEPINEVIRGFGADSYVIQRNDKQPNKLELLPTGLETAEMSVSDIKGESYELRLIEKDDFYTKLTILSMNQAVKNVDVLTENLVTSKFERTAKNNVKEIVQNKNILPEEVFEKQQPNRQPGSSLVGKSTNSLKNDQRDHDSDLPAELNLKITLKGSNLPLKVYLSTISQVTGYNVITTPEIDSQNTSINVENLEVWRVLKSLLYKFSWGFKVSKEDLIITSIETRVFNIRMPAVDQKFTDQTSNDSFTENQNNSTSNGSNYQQNQDVKVGTKIFYENSAPKLSLWTDLESSIRVLVTPQTGSYSISKSSGTVIVTDKPGVLDKIAEIIESTNEILSRQQTFEIQIYEVTLSNANESGVDWGAVEKSIKGVNALSLATNYSSVGFVGGQLLTLSGNSSISGSNGVSAVIKALASQGEVHTISKPKITVTNLFPAVLQEVSSIPYISGTGQTITNNSTISNVTTSQVSDGLTMRLEAKMSEDNRSVLNISVAVNTLDSMTSVPVGGGLIIQEPQVSTKSITTNVEIESDKTFILGGLISTTKNNSVQGIPYLSKIPFLGNAFSYKNISNIKSELVIFISPMKIEKGSFKF